MRHAPSDRRALRFSPRRAGELFRKKKSARALSLGAVAAGVGDKEARGSTALAASPPEPKHRRDSPVR
jgi:hypothetical protein